jgi:hypothetical protein
MSSYRYNGLFRCDFVLLDSKHGSSFCSLVTNTKPVDRPREQNLPNSQSLAMSNNCNTARRSAHTTSFIASTLLSQGSQLEHRVFGLPLAPAQCRSAVPSAGKVADDTNTEDDTPANGDWIIMSIIRPGTHAPDGECGLYTVRKSTDPI